MRTFWVMEGQQSGMNNYMPGRQRPCVREYKHEKGRPKGRPIMQNSKNLSTDP